MEPPQVCSSLRKRMDWATLPLALLQSNSACGKWKEIELATHDVAIPVSTPSASSSRVFCAIFISPRDVGSAKSLNRIERLYTLKGGQDAGIIFLLKHDDNDHQSAVATLMTLQLQLVGNWTLPIIPVESVAAVPATLAILQRQLVPTAANRKVSSPASSILPFCTDDKQPLAEHTVNVLTDVTSGFRDLLDKLLSNAVFESEIAQLLDEDAKKLSQFWRKEYVVD
ncbi:hypothetical protein HD806DRAFT_530282 [Xylariaceae sp. AK1471]|nr:hypothetical protein HD806DRAFT_530282 [Xylariaceae sp. AK1471]